MNKRVAGIIGIIIAALFLGLGLFTTIPNKDISYLALMITVMKNMLEATLIISK